MIKHERNNDQTLIKRLSTHEVFLIPQNSHGTNDNYFDRATVDLNWLPNHWSF